MRRKEKVKVKTTGRRKIRLRCMTVEIIAI
jgi:hypothetical protein